MDINQIFVSDVKNAIENFVKEDSKNYKPSQTLKPSGLKCPRACYYGLLGFQPSPSQTRYNWTNAADTGSRRHEGIQETLLRMTRENYDWEYVSVADYIKEKQEQGRCTNIRVGSTKGAETHLYCDELKMSFFCDGILKYRPTGKYYLFEFKNKKSEKYKKTEFVFPKEHYEQCVVYCTLLDLDEVLLLMEDRNTLELSCPELFKVNTEMKYEMLNKINSILDYAEKQELPPKPQISDSELGCYFCPYKIYCEN